MFWDHKFQSHGKTIDTFQSYKINCFKLKIITEAMCVVLQGGDWEGKGGGKHSS